MLVPIYADHILKAGAGGYGWLMSAAGVGSLIAAITLTRKQNRERLRRNLLIYGLGGVAIPFVGIKLIDVLVTALHLA